jgi:hypothetical protein
MVRHHVFSFVRSRVAAVVRKLLPDPRDVRYPRPAWFSLLRESVSCAWVVLVAYLADVLTRSVLQILRSGFASVGNSATVLHLLLLDRIFPNHLWLLGPLLGVAGLLLLAWRWGRRDEVRESKVLVVRVLRGPTGRQRVQTISLLGMRWLWRTAILVWLVMSSVLVGVLLALVA